MERKRADEGKKVLISGVSIIYLKGRGKCLNEKPVVLNQRHLKQIGRSKINS